MSLGYNKFTLRRKGLKTVFSIYMNPPN